MAITQAALISLLFTSSYGFATPRRPAFLRSDSVGSYPQRAHANFRSIRGLLSSSFSASRSINGFSEIIEEYDGFLVDQWGVLFDAKQPYPGSLAALESLKAAGKKTVLLSNSSKRKSDAVKNLVNTMKFGPPGPEGLYLDIITSGEITFQLVSSGSVPGQPIMRPGTKVYCCGSGDGDVDYVESLGCELAGPEDCDWVLARGNFVLVRGRGDTGVKTVPGGDPADGFADQKRFLASDASGLATAQARGCPMLVANPDMIRPGTNSPMPGQIGAMYADGSLLGGLGGEGAGEVVYVGKPHRAVYDAAFAAFEELGGLKLNAPGGKARLCAVGDALATDVEGGGRHLPGGGSVLIAHGIHAAALGIPEGGGLKPAPEAILVLLADLEGPCVPTHVVPSFVW
mmetsp:Transcript_54340/g.123881  ORF Transcript_54340/g.123881 Transcript_54340/m.123881 type:complete len:400 (-) Transcript_54340:98-1297(-)